MHTYIHTYIYIVRRSLIGVGIDCYMSRSHDINNTSVVVVIVVVVVVAAAEVILTVGVFIIGAAVI